VSEPRDRRPALLLLAALLFLGAMVGLYLWANRASPPPASETAPPRARIAPPATSRAPSGKTNASKARADRSRQRAPRPPKPTFSEDTPSEDEDPLSPVELDIAVVNDSGSSLSRVLVWVASSTGGARRRFMTDTEGKVSARLEPGVLTVVAERADGMLVSRSDPVEVDATDGGSWSVELVIDSEPRAGLGVGIAPHAEGVRVVSVHAGTPAEDAGLVQNDLIVRVEGEETAGMPLPDFIGKMTGPVGTKVLFDVVHEDGSEERLQIERAIIDNR